MLFNSIEFLVFFPIVGCLYFLLTGRWRWGLLLVASYLFYMAWEPAYALLILASTVVDYCVALWMSATESRAKRRFYLGVSLVCNLGLLFTFKYFNFVSASMTALLEGLGFAQALPTLHVLLPVGISFYTFQTLSYTIEVYRGRQEPERHFGIFALYVSFFPQLVAGPIERSYNLLPQLHETCRFDYDRVVAGMRMILWGLFKKVVIADRLGVFVDHIYDTPSAYTGPSLALATLCFTYQIYCDFSGYSDIAIGCARIFGMDLMTNFNRPYQARSLAEFWRRWHISLSSWFRDYLYIPLGGNRVSRVRWHGNILIVFGLSGLWHGASWTFLAWGLVHASYLLTSRATAGWRRGLASRIGLTRLPRAHALWQNAFTFILVALAWIFFRANTLRDAGEVFARLLRGWSVLLTPAGWLDTLHVGRIAPTELLLTLALVALLEGSERLQGAADINSLLTRMPGWGRWTFYAALGLAIMNLGVTLEIPFVYFQF